MDGDVSKSSRLSLVAGYSSDEEMRPQDYAECDSGVTTSSVDCCSISEDDDALSVDRGGKSIDLKFPSAPIVVLDRKCDEFGEFSNVSSGSELNSVAGCVTSAGLLSYGSNPDSLLSNGANPASLLSNGANPAGLLSDGANSAGLHSDGANPAGLLSDGSNPAGLHSDRVNPASLLSDGGNPAGLLSDGANPSGLLSDCADPAGLLSDGANPASLLSDGVNPASILSGGANPAGLLSDGANPARLLSGGANPAGLLSDGANPAGLLSDGANPAGLLSDRVDPAGLHSDCANFAGLLSEGANPAGLLSDGANPTDLSDGANPAGLHSDGDNPADLLSEGANPTDLLSDGANPAGLHSDGANPAGLLSDSANPDGFHSDGANPAGLHSDGANPAGFLSDGANPDGFQSDSASTTGLQSRGTNLSSSSLGCVGESARVCLPVTEQSVIKIHSGSVCNSEGDLSDCTGSATGVVSSRNEAQDGVQRHAETITVVPRHVETTGTVQPLADTTDVFRNHAGAEVDAVERPLELSSLAASDSRSFNSAGSADCSGDSSDSSVIRAGFTTNTEDGIRNGCDIIEIDSGVRTEPEGGVSDRGDIIEVEDDDDGGDVVEVDSDVVVESSVDSAQPLSVRTRLASCDSTDSDDFEVLSETGSESGDATSGVKGKGRWGPVTRGEMTADDLPAIEHLSISVSAEECRPVGEVSATVNTLVLVDSAPDSPPLDIDTLLFLESGRRPLGRVFDVIGQVNRPVYCVRFNSASEIASMDCMKVGAPVCFVPGSPVYTHYVFVQALREATGGRGSDASWWDCNEPPEDQLDFSDDEHERQWRQQRRKRQRSDKRSASPDTGPSAGSRGTERRRQTGSLCVPPARFPRPLPNPFARVSGSAPGSSSVRFPIGIQSSPIAPSHSVPFHPVAESDQLSSVRFREMALCGGNTPVRPFCFPPPAFTAGVATTIPHVPPPLSHFPLTPQFNPLCQFPPSNSLRFSGVYPMLPFNTPPPPHAPFAPDPPY